MTPRSFCLRIGHALISGDTLFDGGPGTTFAAGDLESIIASITSRLHPPPDGVVVMPGHGASTTIGESRRQYAEYVRTHTRRCRVRVFDRLKRRSEGGRDRVHTATAVKHPNLARLHPGALLCAPGCNTS